MLKKSNLIVIILLLCGCVSKHDEIDNSVPEIFYPAFVAFVDSDGRDVLDVVNMTLLRSDPRPTTRMFSLLFRVSWKRSPHVE